MTVLSRTAHRFVARGARTSLWTPLASAAATRDMSPESAAALAERHAAEAARQSLLGSTYVAARDLPRNFVR